MRFEPGKRLGSYEILSLIGVGGMGEVYRARDLKLDREVAIKVLTADLARDPAAVARFEREAKALAALSHPNVLSVHDYGVEGNEWYLVTELLEGESLRIRASRVAIDTGRPPIGKAVEWALFIAHGLAAAHARGLVHRDLKPENVFITTDGLVKILDFGLVRAASSRDPPGRRGRRSAESALSSAACRTCRRNRRRDTSSISGPISSRSGPCSTS